MTRVLFLSNIPTPYQLDFFGALAKSAVVLAVFLWGRESNRDWRLAEKPWLRVLSDSQRKPGWEELRALLEQFKPVHVLVGGYRLPLSIRLRWYCLRHGISFHYWLEKPLPVSGIRALIRRLVWALTLPFAKQVFCIGKEAMAAYGPFSRRIVNFCYSIDASRYAQRRELPSKPLKCLYIGQYIVRKGIPELLEAFAGIAPDQATLSLVGSGELKSLVSEYTQKYSHISEGGFVEPDELPQLISRHDLLLVPSRHDGWAVVVVEAMASGLPVISTRDTGAFAEMGQWVGAVRTGTLCEVDARSIRQAVIGYLSAPERITREGLQGREVMLASPAESKNAVEILLAALK
jgi:poly(glycerol-phosphate) alpha-glucosyltransferase